MLRLSMNAPPPRSTFTRILRGRWSSAYVMCISFSEAEEAVKSLAGGFGRGRRLGNGFMGRGEAQFPSV